MWSDPAGVFDFHLAAEKLLNLLGLGQLVMIKNALSSMCCLPAFWFLFKCLLEKRTWSHTPPMCRSMPRGLSTTTKPYPEWGGFTQPPPAWSPRVWWVRGWGPNVGPWNLWIEQDDTITCGEEIYKFLFSSSPFKHLFWSELIDQSQFLDVLCIWFSRSHC